MTHSLADHVHLRLVSTKEHKVSGFKFGQDADTGESLSLDPRAGHLLVVGAPGRGATQALLRIARSAIDNAITVHIIGARAEREYAAIADRVASIADTPFRITRLFDELSFDLPNSTAETQVAEFPPAHTLLVFDNEHVLLDLAGPEAASNFQRLVRRGREIGVIIVASTNYLPALIREGVAVSDFAQTLHLGHPRPIVKQMLFGDEPLRHASQQPGYGHFSGRTGIHSARVHVEEGLSECTHGLDGNKVCSWRTLDCAFCECTIDAGFFTTFNDVTLCAWCRQSLSDVVEGFPAATLKFTDDETSWTCSCGCTYEQPDWLDAKVLDAVPSVPAATARWHLSGDPLPAFPSELAKRQLNCQRNRELTA